jgi:hypothetical protein
MGVWYVTRETVKTVLDVAETAYKNAQVDRAIEAASRSVEGLLHRRFYPWTGTRYFDWPGVYSRVPWRLWLGANEVISVSAITVDNGATSFSANQYFLRRADGRDEPPYTYVEVNLSTNAAFSAGSTMQRAVAITGVFGHSADETPAGSTAEALDASETGVDVTDSTVGVGAILRVDSERLIVTGKSLLTTGQTLQVNLGDSEANQTVAVTTGSAFTVGEIITLDAERMLIVDIAGNNLSVVRAWDGSTLATHSGSTIYAPRTLTVQRGALGTTAATHLTSATLAAHVVPGPVETLATAYALNTLLQQSSGYARVSGSGDNQREFTGRSIRNLEQDAVRAFGRQARVGAI